MDDKVMREHLSISRNKLDDLTWEYRENSNIEETITYMKNICSILREEAPYFYNKKSKYIDKYYYTLLSDLIYSMDVVSSKKYITPINWNYDFNSYKSFNNPLYLSEIELIELIVYKAFKDLQKNNIYYMVKDFQELDLSDYCKKFSELVMTYSKNYHIECKLVKIKPGYNDKGELFNGIGFHYFNILEFDNNKYIVDGTYKQFFLLKFNILDMLGIPYFSNPKPGLFMLMDEKSINVAKQLLSKCYILMTPENLKLYLDGFTKSYRNGLYYENDINGYFNSSYTYNDYLELLFGNKSLLDYEPEEYIGYQKKPLNNPQLEIKSKKMYLQ